MYYVCVSFLYVTLLETLVKGPRSNRVSRYYLILNALHRLNAHAINCTSTADTLKKMSFFFVLYVSLVQRRIHVNSCAVCPLLHSFLIFFSFFFFFFYWKNPLRLRWRLGRFNENNVYVPTRGNIYVCIY